MSTAGIDRRRILQAAARKLSESRAFEPNKYGEPKFSAMFERAAVLSSFSVDELSPADPSEVNELLDLSRPVYEGQTQRWSLRPSTRKSVLKQLDSVDKIQHTLDSVGSSRADPLGKTIGDIVDGALTTDSDDLGQLSELWSVRQLFSESTDGMPAMEVIKKRIAILNFLKPFHDLAGENFKGRVEELASLADYVGVQETSSVTELISRTFRQVFSLHEKPPIMLFGPGGMGKSTLIARFILDHARALDEGRLPFTYIDFDRTKLSPQQPHAILYEALRQLEIQYPDFGPTFSGLRQSWRAAVMQSTRTAALGGLSAERQRQTVMLELLPHMVREFAKMLEANSLSERPYLLFLDTFEKARFSDRESISAFWRFVDSLQETHPYLRLIIAGRAPIGRNPDEDSYALAEFDLKTDKLELKGLKRKFAVEYLSDGGFPSDLAGRVARRMDEDDAGVSPLTLRVAVAVWKQRQEQGTAALDEQFWSELQAGRIQNQLITRYLDHIEDKDVQGVAGPALLLRVIDADIVSKVLAPSLDTGVLSDAAGLELFEKLRSAIDLFSANHEDAAEIYPRPEVRQALLDLMRDLDVDRLGEVLDQAIDYYTTASDHSDDQERPRLRAEEIYHRLARGDDEQSVRDRWNVAGIDQYLAGVEEELPLQSKALFLSLMGEDVPRELRRAASLATWESDARRRAKEEASPEKRLQILRERKDRSAGSWLYVDEAELLLKTGEPEEAGAVASRGLASLPSTAASGYRVALQLISAKVAYELGDYDEARGLLSQAQRIAVDREDVRKSLEIALLKFEWASELKDEKILSVNSDRLAEAVFVMSDEQLTTHADLVKRAIIGIGADEPRVVLAGIRGGVLEAVSEPGRRRLGRAMSEYDQKVSESQGEKPGVVARSVSISPQQSLNATWQGLFVGLMTLVPVVLNDAFSKFGLAHANKFLEVAVGELRKTQPRSKRAQTTEPMHTVRSWWSRAVGRGRRLTDISSIFVRAFSLDELRLLVFATGRSLESIVSLNNPPPVQVFGLLQMANQEGWLENLVDMAAQLRPSDGELLRIANELETGVVRYQQKELERMAQLSSMLSQEELQSKVAAVARQLCRIDVRGEPVATGLLVGPDLVFTSHAAIQHLSDFSRANDLEFVFDIRADGGTDRHTFKGQDYSFVDVSRHNDDDASDRWHLAYLLVRVDGHPGDEPVLEMETLPEFGASMELSRRHWFDLMGSLGQPRVYKQLLILHHSNGNPLHVTFASRGITEIDQAETRIFYNADTAPGLAGAPCFDADMNIVALHQGTERRRSFGTSIQAIVQSMRENGALDHVGVALA